MAFYKAMSQLLLPLVLLASSCAAQAPVRVLVVYYSQTGNTEALAEAVREGAASVDGVDAALRKVDEVTQEELEAADGIALGSPVYMGDAAPAVREAAVRWANDFGFWDSRALQNKAGAVFATGAFPSNGKEFTMWSMGQTMLQFGMVLVSPYGSVGASATTVAPDRGVDDVEKRIARELGVRLAETARRMRD